MPLVDPEGFEQVVLVGGVLGVERADPSDGGGGDFLGVMLAELDFRPQADVIFRLREQR